MAERCGADAAGRSNGASGVGFQVIGERILGTEELVVEEAEDVAAEFIGVTMGEEGGADVRAFGPFPKELFELVLGFGVFAFEALLFEGDATRDEFAAAEGNDVGKQGADIAQLDLRVVGGRAVMSCGGEANGNPVDEAINQWSGGEAGQRG